KRPLRVGAGEPFTLVRLDLELPLPADVGEMRGNAAGICATASDLYHHFRRFSDGPPDLLDLCRTEPHGRGRSRAARTRQVEKGKLIRGEPKRSSTHTVPPSTEVPPAPNRLCAALQRQRRSGSVPRPAPLRAIESLPGCHSGRSERGPALLLQAR